MNAKHHGLRRHRRAGAPLLLLLITLAIPQAALADDTEEVLLTRFFAEGRYGIVADGQGMYHVTNPGPGTIEINVPGSAVVAAYLYWSGYAHLGGGDDRVTVTRSSDGTSMEVTPDPVYGTHGPIDWYDEYYYYSYTADVTSLVVTGPESYTISDFGGQMVRRNGAGLVVVYEDASLPYNAVEIKDGIDRFYRGWGEGPRAESAVSCLEFAPYNQDRILETTMFAAEVRRTSEEPDRPTALYYLTGTEADAQPADMVNAPTDGPITGNVLAGPPGPYPFASGDDPQWDTYVDQITFPAGHSWACYQVESAQDRDLQPASGVWLLLAGAIGAEQPTTTPTHTPTPTPTPTLTPTPTTTNTPTATATFTATPTPTDSALTPTVPPTPRPTFTATFQPTEPPSPPPVVPEASSLVLVGSSAAALAGYVGLAIRARRKS